MITIKKRLFMYLPINYNEAQCLKEVINSRVEYLKYQFLVPPLLMHVVKIKAFSGLVDLIPAQEERETVSSIAKRMQACIAINGANYRRGGKYNGNRVNLCFIKNNIFADPCYLRGALAWSGSETCWIIDTISSCIELTIGTKKFPVHGINQPRGIGQSILYNTNDVRCFHHNPGYAVFICNDRIDAIQRKDFSFILDYDFIYQTDTIEDINLGMKVDLSYNLKTADNHQIKPDFALGGAGLLLKNSSICPLSEEFSYSLPLIHMADEISADFNPRAQQDFLINVSHPRTAFGVDVEKNVYLVVVDGRQKASIGITLYDLARFMQFLGCKEAINLGGGGCSTLYCNGLVLNQPSQGYERTVSEALCFFV